MYYVHESNSCTNNDFYETMKYSFQKVPSLTNSPLLTTGQSTWVNQKEENLSFTGAYSAVFILFNTFAIKTTKKKTSIDGVSFKVALKQKHSHKLRLLSRVHVQEISAVQTV